MFKKITLLILFVCIIICGFAQKSKRKSVQKNPKNEYFAILVNGTTTLAEQYCPEDTVTFDFEQLDPNINMDSVTYCWCFDITYFEEYCDTTPLKQVYEYKDEEMDRYHWIEFRYSIKTDTTDFVDTIRTTIKVDYIRTELDTSVCQGRNITVPTLYGDTTFYDVHSTQTTKWEVYTSASGCDSLVRWVINVDEYITFEYKISSCDSVVWGDTIFRKPANQVGDTTMTKERIFFASDPNLSCDTLILLTVTIIDTGILKIDRETVQKKFCEGDDMGGTIDLETNYTAFDWCYNSYGWCGTGIRDEDTAFTVFEPFLEIEYAGYYHVFAYMDTSLYDTLKDLRIVNNCPKSDTILIHDCELFIPNVITPDGDGYNEWFAIKKLNPKRDNDLTIYDRWGKNVFHKRRYECIHKGGKYENTEEAFDGTSRDGRKLPEGTYFYALKYDAIPKRKTYTGTLLILRGNQNP